MGLRQRQPSRADRPARQLAFTLVAAAIASAATAVPVIASPTRDEGPPSILFRQGYNLCHAASLTAIRKAGGQRYKPGLFVNGSCNWERSDLKAGIVLSTHTPSVGATLMHDFLAQNGKNGLEAKAIRVPGASKAVLVTLPPSASQGTAEDLFAAYARGVIQVDMTAPLTLPDTRPIAIVNLVART